MTASAGDRHFDLHFWPTRPYGRWSVGSALAVVVGQIAFWLATLLGQDRSEFDTFFDNWWLAAPGLVMVVGGLSALVSGVLAMSRERDRSIGVALSILIGLLVALFLVFAE
jgi:multisubunit Na+/H+ antiporter MnhB subunit